MPKAAQKTRRYESPRRREQAEATRRAILEAAERLFVADGYAGTSMSRIASEARVALKTVYLAFETKAGLLRALWHLRLRGDSDEVPVGQREWFREVLEEPDPERQLRLNARNSRRVKERLALLTEVLAGAASADPDAASLHERMQKEFYENQRTVLESIDAKGALAEDLGLDRATDLLWTLNHPASYLLLTRDRGWTPDEYEQWLADVTVDQLLR
jgi:AcrR family transcriptional regulator